MKKYEVIITFDPDVNEEGITEQLKKLHEMIASFDGKVITEENTGKQALAYPMKKKSYGTYVLLVVEANSKFVAEFARQMRINDTVLRFMACIRDDASGTVITRAEERSTRPTGGRERFSRDRDRGSDSRGSRDRKPAESDDKKKAVVSEVKDTKPVSAKDDTKAASAKDDAKDAVEATVN